MNVRLAKSMPAKAKTILRLIGSHQLDHVEGADCGALEFSAALGSTLDVAGTNPPFVRYVGTGDSTVSVPELRSALGSAMRGLPNAAVVGVDLSLVEGIEPNELVAAAVVAACLGAYQFSTYKSSPPKSVNEIVVLCPGATPKALQQAEAVVSAVTFARDCVNEPGGTLTPSEFAARAKQRAQQAELSVTVMGPREIAKQRLGGLLAVSRGSAQEPRFVKISYSPPRPVGPSVALVGKGITFDSGGLSIKPADAMMTMKCDMGGAAAVIAAVCALPALKIPVAVTAYVPMTDNMLGGDASRPGDIFTARNGKTVEVLNTDAEGRLVLADALSLATDADHDVIVDLATLTGACMVALGPTIAGVLSNNDDLADAISQSGARVGERFWRLPLAPEYRKMLDSPIADIKNIGSRYGGTITAGLFLQEFVGEETSWAHLDIAGPAFCEEPHGETTLGGTGFGVQTLIDLLAHFGQPRGTGR